MKVKLRVIKMTRNTEKGDKYMKWQKEFLGSKMNQSRKIETIIKFLFRITIKKQILISVNLDYRKHKYQSQNNSQYFYMG
jgi:hypothetical protein